MSVNMSSAFNYVNKGWLWILSDDDVLQDNFLKGINLNKFSNRSLFITRINIINEDDIVVRTNNEYTKNIYTKNEAMNMFFDLKIQNHLSLMVFSRELYQEIGKFC